VQNRKLLNLISAFNNNELKQFKDFVSSPYFNKSRKVIKLCDYIIKQYPDFSAEKITEKNIHSELFPETHFNASTIRHLFTDLLKLCEKFLVQVNLSRRKFDVNDFLLEELSLRNQNDLLSDHLKQIEEFYSTEGFAGGDNFLNKFKIETERFNFEVSKRQANSRKSSDAVLKSITKRNKYLISFFVVEIIKGIDALNLLSHKFEFKNQNNLTSHFLNAFDLSKLILFLKNHPELSEFSFIFDTYYKLFMAFTNIDYEAFYYDYKESIRKHSSKFSRNELSYLNKKLIDYCILKGKTGRQTSNFEEELFNVYEYIIIRGYYITSNNTFLSTSLYRNILILALRQKKFSWADNFVKNFLKKIHPSFQKNIHNYSLAMICFEKSDFEKVLEHLNKIKLDNFDMKVDVKNMLVKVYYKLDYLEEVIYAIYSYKEFLRYNSDISYGRKKSHNNFLKFTKDLVKLKTIPDDTKCEYIRRRIIDTSELVSKRWLIECVEEIRNSKYNTYYNSLRRV
jgi:hypothetical protein